MKKETTRTEMFLVFLSLTFFFATHVFANSTDTTLPTSATSTSGPNSPWTDPSNISISDDIYVSNTLTSSEDPENQNTNNLKTSGFGFNIPSDMQIDGIVLEIEKHASFANDNANVKDLSVRLVRPDGTNSTDNKADAITFWGTEDNTTVYGAPTDLWGNTWTVADINNSNFGASISARLHANATISTANIDALKITVYYSALPPPETPEPPENPEPEQNSGGGGGNSSGSTTKIYFFTPSPIITPEDIPPVLGEVLGDEIFLFTLNLKLGSRGNEVTELQKKLVKENVYPGPVTGYFGPLTFYALKTYQTYYNIPPVGRVGPLTRNKLNSNI